MTVDSGLHKHLQGLLFSDEAQRYISVIEENFQQDFSTSGRGYFNLDDEIQISEKAFTMVKEKLIQQPTPVSEESLKKCWHEVVVDFHRNNFWNFELHAKKPQAALTEDQKTQREMWPYIWVLIQSGIILKTIVYYFGLRASEEPNPENKLYLVLALCTSAGTLIFFAWRKHRQ